LPVANVYGKSVQARSENPNSPTFGKSVHEERKSTSERNGKKQSRGGTLEQQAQALAATPEPPTKPKNTSTKADDEEPKPKQHPACDAAPKTNSEKTQGTTTGNVLIEFTARLAARHGPDWNTKETIRVCKAELDRYDVSLADFLEWDRRRPALRGRSEVTATIARSPDNSRRRTGSWVPSIQHSRSLSKFARGGRIGSAAGG
jgi:hypothetical protein